MKSIKWPEESPIACLKPLRDVEETLNQLEGQLYEFVKYSIANSWASDFPSNHEYSVTMKISRFRVADFTCVYVKHDNAVPDIFITRCQIRTSFKRISLTQWGAMITIAVGLLRLIDFVVQHRSVFKTPASYFLKFLALN